MPLHLAARLHAAVHGLFRSTDEAETRALYKDVCACFVRQEIATPDGRQRLIDWVAEQVADALDIGAEHSRRSKLCVFVERVFDDEQFFVIPDVDWSRRRSVSEWWEIREALQAQEHHAGAFDDTVELICLGLFDLLQPLLKTVPDAPKKGATPDLILRSTLMHTVERPGEAFDAVIDTAFARELTERQLFARLRSQLERNIVAASGGNPYEPQSFTRTPVFPSKSAIQDASTLAATYLNATPLLGFLNQPIAFPIPTHIRFEHCHIVAGSGHGKTQTLQYLICQDLPAVAAGERSIIVLDSQGDLIRNVARLNEFAPDGPLHERIVLIDPSDVEWPVSLNLFDVGIERLQGYDPLERERLTNSILELYDFVLGTLLAAEMTQKQNVIFRYVTRLMLYIPDATIHTLRELMEPDSHIRFAPHIEKLSGTAKRFFETEFMDREFTQTRKQVLRRLWGILENQTFERMFSHPRSKLDLFQEMNAGKVILINTAKDLLKEQGSEIFGRFFIALIAQAAQERATLPETRRLPTFVYIDEAADYFDRTISTILTQARKYGVGMVLAHQYLGQLDARLQDAFAANTAIKFAGGVSAKDARALAPMLRTVVDVIEQQPKGHFACYVRSATAAAVPVSFPLGFLEQKPRMSAEAFGVLRDRMRARYAVHYKHRDDVTSEVAPTPAVRQERAGDPDEADTSAGETW